MKEEAEIEGRSYKPRDTEACQQLDEAKKGPLWSLQW